VINFARLRSMMRNYLAGGDAGQWHFDDSQAELRMTRFVDGRWEYRPATSDEATEHAQTTTLWMPPMRRNHEEGRRAMDALPDDWYIEPTGESRILDQNKVADEIERLRAENSNLRGAMQSIRSIVLAARELEKSHA
jgi:hypothetical protein